MQDGNVKMVIMEPVAELSSDSYGYAKSIWAGTSMNNNRDVQQVQQPNVW